jgi:hypothetical protein
MCEILHHRSSFPTRQRGVALLMVLLIVLAIAILATGFVAGTDTELMCGVNILMRLQMDQLAESGPSMPAGWFCIRRMCRPTSGPTGRRTSSWPQIAETIILCGPRGRRTSRRITARMTSPARPSGSSAVRKPGAAGWPPPYGWTPASDCGPVATSTSARRGFSRRFTQRGKVVVWRAAVDRRGCFHEQLAGIDHRAAQRRQPTVPGLGLQCADHTNPEYANGMVAGTLSGSTYPPAIRRTPGNLVLAGNVTIRGMLLVGGNLIIRGNGNKIVAAQKLPGALCRRPSDDRED